MLKLGLLLSNSPSVEPVAKTTNFPFISVCCQHTSDLTGVREIFFNSL